MRLAEIVSADGGPRVYIRLVKTLPDGTPASFFAPPELVESRVQIEVKVTVVFPHFEPMIESFCMFQYILIYDFCRVCTEPILDHSTRCTPSVRARTETTGSPQSGDDFAGQCG